MHPAQRKRGPRGRALHIGALESFSVTVLRAAAFLPNACDNETCGGGQYGCTVAWNFGYMSRRLLPLLLCALFALNALASIEIEPRLLGPTAGNVSNIASAYAGGKYLLVWR